MTAEPIPLRVLRWRCPNCTRSASRPGRIREHMTRCWYIPENRGCMTCRSFHQDAEGEGCAAGVDLSGHPQCARCDGFGYYQNGMDVGGPCPECDNNPEVRDEVKAGPIIHCDLWQREESDHA